VATLRGDEWGWGSWSWEYGGKVLTAKLCESEGVGGQ
jgi:hypothetical protein